MTQYDTWISYSGTAKIMLTFVLLAAAGGVTLAGHFDLCSLPCGQIGACCRSGGV